MRTLLRYLGGAVLVVAVIVTGVVIRIIQVAGSDERAVTATRHRYSRPVSITRPPSTKRALRLGS